MFHKLVWVLSLTDKPSYTRCMIDDHPQRQRILDYFEGRYEPPVQKPIHPWFHRAYDRQAAVFIGITAVGEPRLLLTQRAKHMSKHAGEVAFAGGMVDDTDTDKIHTALRELHEEVGLWGEQVQAQGIMRPMVTRHDVRVTPVVGFYDGSAGFTPCEDEIGAIFEVPLSFLLDASNVRLTESSFLGRATLMPSYDYQGYHIWGVTAYILIDFLTTLYAVDLPGFQLID